MKQVAIPILKKASKTVLTLVMIGVVLFAVVMGLARFFMPSLEQYEQKFATYITQETGLLVKFTSFAGDWYRFGPALKITDMVFSTESGEKVVTIDTLYVSVNILASLTQGQIVPAYVNVLGLDVDIHQDQSGWSVVGWPSSEDARAKAQRAHELLLDLSKEYSSITVRRSQVNIKSLNAKIVPINIRRAVLSRSGSDHQLDLLLNLLNQPTQLEVVAQVHGNLAQPADLKIHSYFKLERANFDDYLQHYIIGDYAIDGGNVDLTAWVDWQAGHVQKVQTEVDIEQLLLWSYAQGSALERLNLKSELLWESPALGEWDLSGANVLLGFDHAELESVITQFKLNRNNEGQHFVAETVDLTQVAKILLYSGELSTAQHTLLRDLAPRGLIQNIKMDLMPDTWQLGLQFNQLGFHSGEEIPGAENLAGELLVTPNSGKIKFASENAWIDYTTLFPEDFLFSEIKGDVFWEYGGKFWQVNTDKLLFKNADLDLSTHFLIKGGDGLDTYLDIAAVTDNIDTLKVQHYLPTGELSKELTDWLTKSLGPGEVEHFDLQVLGPAKDFPNYDAGNGTFRLHLNVKDQELTFDPDWPKIEHANAEMLLVGRQLQISMSQGQLFGVGLEGVLAEVALPDNGPYWLKIRSEALLSAQEGINFLHVTPLAEEFDPYFNLFAIDAPLTLTLDLAIPLDSEKEEVQVNGLVQVSEGNVYAKEWGLHFSELSGVLGFTQKGAYSQGLNAKLFNKPVLLTIAPIQEKNQTLTAWQLKGTLSVPEIAKQVQSVIWDYASGASTFTARLLTGGNTPSDFSISSDLHGIALNLPAPLNKTAAQQTPFRYTTSMGTPDTRMRFEFNHVVDGVLQFSKAQSTTTNAEEVLTGGHIQLGGALTNLEVPAGVVVKGELKDFSVDLWRDFITAFQEKNKTTKTKAKGLADELWKQLQQVDVSVAKLEAFHYPLSKAQVRLNRATDAWMLKLVSREWEGQARIPFGDKAPVQLNFDYCHWDTSRYTEGTSTLDPRDIPAIIFSCKEFIYNQKSLGTVKLETEPQELGLRLSRVEMLRKNDTLKASGQWYYAPNGERTRLSGFLTSEAIDKTLLLVDIKSTILNSKSKTDFTLSWSGSPFDFALAHVSGELDVHLNKGILVDVNPGFGRVLSLLSVQSLERRLRLDFSDVFKKGFSFDDIKAAIVINNGLAHVNSLVVKAPAAEIKMQGDVNLANKQLDLSANVVAHISGSLPIAATIASGGNPIVGALGVGVWAVDKIVKSQAGDKLGSNYHITGSWEKPIVKGK